MATVRAAQALLLVGPTTISASSTKFRRISLKSRVLSCQKWGPLPEALPRESTRGTRVLVKASSASLESGEVSTADAEVNDLETAVASGEDKNISDTYSATMQQAMGDNDLVYRHDRGMNFARVLPDLIVGSCLQKPADVDLLRDEASVGTILCLQEDSDMAYFNLDLAPILQRIQERRDIQHLRVRIRDFDPFSLRKELPLAVAKLHKAIREGKGSAYIHCTAGLGRAPAVALAYMFWLRSFQLAEANAALQKVRRCSPKLLAIRAATCDLLTGGSEEPVVLTWRGRGTISSVEVAGLDVGWHNRLALQRQVDSNAWTLHRQLPVGTYYYKYIVNGIWTTNPDAQITQPDQSGAVNNFVDVVGGSADSAAWALRKRLMEDGALLTDTDRAAVVQRLDALADALP